MPTKDFFVSYNSQDKEWAEWIAWQLEAAGYSTVIQAWDFRPGGNFVLDMQQAAAEAERTIVVLSQHYLEAAYTQPEWAAAFAQDPTGAQKKLLPVRVQECDLTGMLSQIVYIDLVGKAEEEARELLLAGVQRGRAKPSAAPGFPSAGDQLAPPTQAEKPAFPVEAAWGQQYLSPEARAAAASPRNSQIGGVNISGVSGSSINIGGSVSSNVSAGGDVVGGDKITTTGPAGNQPPQVDLATALVEWRQAVEAEIKALSDLDDEEKSELQEKVARVEQEAGKAEGANPGKLERLLNTMGAMAPDILVVTAKMLQNPFAGVGLVLEKGNGRVKVKRADR